MARTLLRIIGLLAVLVALGSAAVLAPRYFAHGAGPAEAWAAPFHRSAAHGRTSSPRDCVDGRFAVAAAANGAALDTLAWMPFGRAETGWATYEPLMANTIGTDCPGNSGGFAHALAAWQSTQGLRPTGLFDPDLFAKMQLGWEMKRPFVRLAHTGVCPDGPPEETLATAAPAESYGGKTIQLRNGTLEAYRRMLQAGRAEAPEAFADPAVLEIFSGFRSPSENYARCLMIGGCGGPEKANCSAHRTGLALDMNLGHAPGFGPDSTADPNRLFISQTPAYRWMVRNASRFGFVNYPFEPWHWEWIGEAP